MDLVGILVRFLAPDARPDAYNDWRLVATTTLGPWGLGAVALFVVVALVLSGLGLQRLTPARRRVLGTLRILAAALVFGLVLQPAIELRAVSKVRSRIALLVDGSHSMGLAAAGGTRADRVAKHLSDNAVALSKLSKEAVFEPSTFAERVHPVESLPSPLPTDGKRTDLARALAEISFQSSGRDLGAVILYSDGTDTEGLTVQRAHAIGEQLKAPIYTIGFNAEASAKDLAIRRIVVDDFAFVHNTVTMDVDLEQQGFQLGSVPVTLKRDGEVIATKEARMSADGRGRVSFEFKPTKLGKISYQVSVPLQPGEVVESNNSRSVVLKVIRDRIRVLQVAGRPSWDERFLRELLKRNPNVDLISFFILRTSTDLTKAQNDELALIPFPVNELFTQELDTFDVVIFQNFSYRPYRMQGYLPNVADYVQKGGSFVMIGGDNSFEDGWYGGTPIADVLPVRIGGAPQWDPAQYTPRLTREGRLHPITRIGDSGEPPESAYARLPQLVGVNQSLSLMPNSQSLLVHPSLPGNPPVVAIREVGNGRSLAVTTDSLWSWRFIAVGEGGAGREFDRFWNSALRWLIRDPELARIRLRTDQAVYALGEPVSAEIRVLGTDYHGLAGAEVRAELVRISSQGDAPPAAKQVFLQSGADGNAVATFGELGPGTYLLKAEARAEGELIGRTEEPVIVEASDVESQAPFPRPDLLAALAEGSGGKAIDIDDPLPDIDVRDPRRVEVDRTRQVPIWDKPAVFLALLLLLAAEWWLRRRSGLL